MTDVPVVFAGAPIFDMTEVREGDCPHGNGTLFYRDDLPDGTAFWHDTEKGRRLDYICPCGCKNARSLLIKEIPPQGVQVEVIFGCRWKGWITEDQWWKPNE